jgi:hypothetical protein
LTLFRHRPADRWLERLKMAFSAGHRARNHQLSLFRVVLGHQNVRTSRDVPFSHESSGATKLTVGAGLATGLVSTWLEG